MELRIKLEELDNLKNAMKGFNGQRLAALKNKPAVELEGAEEQPGEPAEVVEEAPAEEQAETVCPQCGKPMEDGMCPACGYEESGSDDASRLAGLAGDKE